MIRILQISNDCPVVCLHILYTRAPVMAKRCFFPNAPLATERKELVLAILFSRYHDGKTRCANNDAQNAAQRGASRAMSHHLTLATKTPQKKEKDTPMIHFGAQRQREAVGQPPPLPSPLQNPLPQVKKTAWPHNCPVCRPVLSSAGVRATYSPILGVFDLMLIWYERGFGLENPKL